MKSLFRTILIVGGFVFFLIVTFAITWKIFEKRAEEDLSQHQPRQFPVVVITPERSKIVLSDELGAYERDNPDYSFLVPEGKDGFINQQLAESQRERGAKGQPEIRVKRISDGKQLIELEIHTDGLFLSRYEATDKENRPLMLKMAGPLFVFLPCGATMLVGVIGIFGLRLVSRALRNKRQAGLIGPES